MPDFSALQYILRAYGFYPYSTGRSIRWLYSFTFCLCSFVFPLTLLFNFSHCCACLPTMTLIQSVLRNLTLALILCILKLIAKILLPSIMSDQIQTAFISGILWFLLHLFLGCFLYVVFCFDPFYLLHLNTCWVIFSFLMYEFLQSTINLDCACLNSFFKKNVYVPMKKKSLN